MLFKPLVTFGCYFVVYWPAGVEGDCFDLSMVNRRQWGGCAHRGRRVFWPVQYVFVHETGGATCTDPRECLLRVRDMYKDFTKCKGWSDIGYNFVIGGDGRIYEGAGWNIIGTHTFGWNSRSIGVGFIGTFEANEAHLNMHQAFKGLMDCGVKGRKLCARYGLYGHRDGSCTRCPGEALYGQLKSWANWHMKGPIKVFCHGKYLKPQSENLTLVLKQHELRLPWEMPVGSGGDRHVCTSPRPAVVPCAGALTCPPGCKMPTTEVPFCATPGPVCKGEKTEKCPCPPYRPCGGRPGHLPCGCTTPAPCAPRT